VHRAVRIQMGALDLGLGLQTISAKNLALASQSLGAVAALLGRVRDRFVALLPPKMQVGLSYMFSITDQALVDLF